MAKQPIIIIHLPKTAGSSLRTIIQRNHRNREIYLAYNQHPVFGSTSELKTFRSDDFEKYKIIMGHFAFSTDLFPFHDRRFATILRNPVERVISYYHHIMNSEEWQGREISLSEYLQTSNDVNVQFRNHQTRLLSGIRTPDITSGHLKQARENLEKHFIHVGFTEDFSNTIEFFSEKFNWRNRDVLNENVTPNRWPAGFRTEQDIEHIRELNQHDVELYQWAKSRFAR